MKRLVPLCVVAPLLAAGCGEPDLEVRGVLDRVIGETVTLKLTSGDTGFSGDLELVDARARRFSAAALKINKKDDRELTFAVPAAAAQGKATARVGRTDDKNYTVPLEINRLALALDDKGAIEVLPLPPATISAGAIGGISAAGGQISLAPGGGELAILTQDQLHLLALKAPPAKPVAPAITQTGNAIAAVPGGVLVCTDSALTLVSFKGGSTSQISAPLAGCKALAADRAGTKAVVLNTCNSTSDCLTVYDIGTSITQVTNPPITLDNNPGARHVAMRPDGKGAVVADVDGIYGVWLDVAGVPNPVTVSWPGSSPSVAGLAMAPLATDEIFAAADATNKQVLLLGFDSTVLKQFIGGDIPLPEAPTAMGFGVGTQLFVATSTKVYSVDALNPGPPSAAGITAANPVLQLVVQP